MTRIKDLVSIKKDSFFNGAVQAEWFYDAKKRSKVSESYIFHGPKYYGVSKNDVRSNNYKLTDTVSFTRSIYNKIYDDLDSSRFMLTIAGYGAGKSHLSLALASMLSSVTKKNHDSILNNIKDADEEGYEYLKKYDKDKHLVIVLNGINDFNLNMEVLKVAKETLKLHKLDDSIFNDMSQAHKTAKTFLDRTYDYLSDLYLSEAEKYPEYAKFTKVRLKKLLTDNIEKYDAYSIINSVYKSQTGNEISISEGISANTVLTKLHKKYVEEEKIFKSVIILFDEFGRYLEFASNQPNIAGETGLQQIFEAVQNANKSMLFIGFIQSDLSAYISRVKNENIIRYVGRYQISDKYYLSSNLETVIASLIKKEESSERIIGNIFDNTLNKHFISIQKNILRWTPEFNDKNVWSNEMMFNKTLLKGSYPIHPLTTGILSSLAAYMQQRSTLTFLSDIFEKYENLELNEQIPFIYPTAVIDSGIFDEMINAEERGRVSGQFCLQYRDIVQANEETLNENLKNILRAILIMNLSKYKVFDKTDTSLAIRELTGLSEDTVTKGILELEAVYGVIFFDNDLKRYNFMNDGNSKVDFNKIYFKKKGITSNKNILKVITGDLETELGLDRIEDCEFGIINNIVTKEWSYDKEFIEINEFDFDRAAQFKIAVDSSCSIDTPRGKLINLYCNGETYNKVEEISKILKELKYKESAISVMLIHDESKIIEDSLFNIRALNSFTLAEKESFKKFYDKEMKENIKQIIRTYTRCAASKKYITEDGVIIESLNIKKVMNSKFEDIYTRTVPFAIDSFEKKIGAKSRKYYYSVIDALLGDRLNDKIEFEALPIDIRNRINSIFSSKSERGWKIFFGEDNISESQNLVVREIADEIKSEIINLKSGNGVKLRKFTVKYKKKPYGLNEYSVTLLVLYALYLIKENLVIKNGINKYRLANLRVIFANDKAIKFSEFDNCEVFYTEEKEEDKILTVIRTVEKNRGVSLDAILKLQTDFNKIDDNDVPVELRGRYFSAKEKIQAAQEKNNITNNLLIDAEKKYFAINKRPVGIVRLLRELSIIDEYPIQGINYLYSPGQIQLAKDIREKSIELYNTSVIDFYEKALLSNVKDQDRDLKLTIKGLSDLGYEESAELTKKARASYVKRVNSYQAAIKELNVFKNTIEKMEIQIKDADNIEFVEKEISQWLEKKNVLEVHKYDDFKVYFNKLDNLNSTVKSIKHNIKTVLDEVSNDIKSINSLADISKVTSKINSKMNNGVTTAIKTELVNVVDALANIKECFSEFLYKNFKIEELNLKVKKVKNQYSDQILIIEVIEKINLSLILKYNKFEQQWLEKYIISESQLESLTPQKLNKLKTESAFDLEYLSKELISKQKLLVKKIDIKLEKIKINNIISLFEELSDDEKEKCIKELSSLYN